MIDLHKQDIKFIMAKGEYIRKMMNDITEYINKYGTYIELRLVTWKHARSAAKFGGIKEILMELELMGEIKIVERKNSGNDFDVGHPSTKLLFINKLKKDIA